MFWIRRVLASSYKLCAGIFAAVGGVSMQCACRARTRRLYVAENRAGVDFIE